MDTTSLVLSALVSIVGSSAVAAAVSTFLRRKEIDVNVDKTKADSAAVLSQTAIDLSTAATEKIGELRIAWAAHREWDKGIVKKARDAGIDFDDPPQLWL